MNGDHLSTRIRGACHADIGTYDQLGQARDNGVMQLSQRHIGRVEFPQDGKSHIPRRVYLLVPQVAHARGVRREHTQSAALPYLHVDAVAWHQAVESGLRQVAVAHGKVSHFGHPAGLNQFARRGHHDDVLVIVRARHLAQHRAGTGQLAPRESQRGKNHHGQGCFAPQP